MWNLHCAMSHFGDPRIVLRLFADDVVLLVSSDHDLQRETGWFSADCEAAGIRVSTSKSETMVLCWIAMSGL